MDPKPFDPARAAVGPEGLDLIESFAEGRINRRDFVRRGTVIGLSVPFLGAVIAACGGDDDDATTGTDADGGSDTTPGSEPASTGGTGTAGGMIRVATQRPAGPLDPIAMQDLGTYGIVAQCFEFLTTLGDSEMSPGVGPGLAESWEPNEDGSVWTFNLRQGVKWHDGTDFTSADVAATMDRLAAAANAGLNGVIEAGSVDSSDPTKAVFTLLAPNGSLPYLVSVYNAQSVITPAAYESGTTLDASPNGTGPFKLTSFDAATGAEYERNADWWGGAVPLDGSIWSFFDEEGSMVTAASAGEVDALVQFQAIGGDALFNDPNFNVLTFQASTHRQIWMRCDTGQFADPRVRRALGMCLDRQALVDTLFEGQADIGNDHVIAPVYPFFDSSVPQRERDVDGARALLAEAGFEDGLDAVLHFGELQEIPELAQLIQAQASEGGFNIELAGESLDTFYGTQWCPPDGDPPCSASAELGIVDYGHRATPDVYLNAALSTGGVWNSSQYSSPAFDAAFAEYSAAIDVEARQAACKTIEEILLEDSPILVPYFYNYIAGFSNRFTGVRVSALGQMFLDQAATA